jgi:hypothetical protein
MDALGSLQSSGIVSLTQTMVQIDSSTPGSGSNTAGETTVAQYICACVVNGNVVLGSIPKTVHGENNVLIFGG